MVEQRAVGLGLVQIPVQPTRNSQRFRQHVAQETSSEQVLVAKLVEEVLSPPISIGQQAEHHPQQARFVSNLSSLKLFASPQKVEQHSVGAALHNRLDSLAQLHRAYHNGHTGG